MSSPPNVIYILSDDQRADYMGSAGHQVLQTPNLDQLAHEGVYFSNAFCTSPTCTPSRACHYTGQWERKHGINFNSQSSLAPEAWEASFPMQLKQHGYFTGWIGKNHVPAGDGGYESGYFEDVFDYWYGNHNHSGFYPKEFATGGEIYRNAAEDTQVEVFLEGALNFLQPDRRFFNNALFPLPQRPDDRPFCLCITFNLPHSYGTGTMQLRPSDDELYKSAYRDRQGELHPPKTYMNYVTGYRNPRLPRDVYNGHYLPSYDYVKTPHALRERQVRTCQTITGIDRMLGILRGELDRLGLADNTIIIYSTDHGLHHGEHGLGGKCFLYEEDIRIPLIIYDPRLPDANRGQMCEEMVVVPDLAPTVMDLAGFDVPVTMQGQSVCPLLENQPVDWRQDIFTEQLMDNQNYPRSESVRSAAWKYIRYFERTEDPRQAGFPFRGTLDNYADKLTSTLKDEKPVYEELFHLADDPCEEHNLAQDPAYFDMLEEMRARILVLGRQIKGDDSPPPTLPYQKRGR